MQRRGEEEKVMDRDRLPGVGAGGGEAEALPMKLPIAAA